MTIDTKLIQYTGHLGPVAVFDLRQRPKAVRMKAGEIRALPSVDATDLVRHGGAVAVLALPEIRKRLKLTKKALQGLDVIVDFEGTEVVPLTRDVVEASRATASEVE